MTNYILRRLLQMVVVMFLLSFFCYALLNLMPGDPLDIMLSSNPRITSEDIAKLKELYGVDKPLYVKYFNWLTAFVQGDFGYSRTYKIPAKEMIGPRLINTFFLAFGALVLSIVLAIPLGMIAALKKGTRFDYFVNMFAFTGISVPSFWLGIVLILLFGVYFKILPAGGTYTIGIESKGLFVQFLDRLRYIVLPMFSLMFLEMGIFVRYTRATMIEVMGKDYIRTARAKGLLQKRVLFVHALKNALIPLITIVSLSVAFIFAGAIITETVFAYQGIGKLVYDSIVANDFNVAMVSFMLTIVMVLFFNLVADILYGVVDPRISYK
ncbi:MAG: ABC transporter permease [Chitinivibrionales bacterium]|nr:ABC transporter permease [Chitinivibrionales bacterium]